ncbi:MAG: RnfH family protein [Rhodanobacteraceae bacterium]
MCQLELPAGSTVEDAITRSGVYAACPELNDVPLRAGIFSKAARLDQVLHDGDRVELYRPLQLDPMEARRRRAAGRKPSP